MGFFLCKNKKITIINTKLNIKILGREFSVFQCRDESPSLSSLKSYHNIYKVSIIYTKIHDSKTKDHDISIMIYLIYRMGTIQIYACGVHSL